jgi:hypothetical protein
MGIGKRSSYAADDLLYTFSSLRLTWKRIELHKVINDQVAPGTEACDAVGAVGITCELPVVRPESAARVSTLTSIHKKSLQPQLDDVGFELLRAVRTAERSCS